MRILVVDDNEQSLQSLAMVLEDLGHEPAPCATPLLALSKAKETFYPLIITDIRMPGMDGLSLLSKLKEDPVTEQSDVVIITGHADMQTAVEALRKGAYDYLNKPINAKELAVVVERSAEHQALRIENRELKERMDEKVEQATRDVVRTLEATRLELRKVAGIGSMVAESRAMKTLVDECLIMHSNPGVPVLIEGETGTGKEVLARLIHHGNGVAEAPFIGINCAAIPAELFESELFGHEAGAYTGSRTSGAPGKLEAAENGTVFLDEVAELPIALQPKLLRALEERAFYRLGGVKKREFKARVICAANRNLTRMVEKGLFRRDLYHRLRVGHLVIPPLRERKEDMAVLCDMILRRESERKKKHFKSFSEEAMRRLLRHDWPGNIRELENTLERAVLMHDGPLILPEHLHFPDNGTGEGSRMPAADAYGPEPGPGDTGPGWIPFCHDGKIILPEDPFSLEELNNSIIEEALRRFDGNKSRAAGYLGMSRFALHRKVQGK